VAIRLDRLPNRQPAQELHERAREQEEDDRTTEDPDHHQGRRSHLTPYTLRPAGVRIRPSRLRLGQVDLGANAHCLPAHPLDLDLRCLTHRIGAHRRLTLLGEIEAPLDPIEAGVNSVKLGLLPGKVSKVLRERGEDIRLPDFQLRHPKLDLLRVGTERRGVPADRPQVFEQ